MENPNLRTKTQLYLRCIKYAILSLVNKLKVISLHNIIVPMIILCEHVLVIIRIKRSRFTVNAEIIK